MNKKSLKRQLKYRILSRIPGIKQQVNKAIVLGITHNLTFALGSFIIGLLKHNPRFNETIVVFHDGISQDQQSVLIGLYPKISFRLFQEQNVQMRLKNAKVQSADNIIKRYSYLYFAKFEIFDLLKEFKQVIWMDVDMLIRGSISDLWKFSEFCWRETLATTAMRQQSMYDAFSTEIGKVNYVTPNGGLIGVSRKALTHYNITSNTPYKWFARFQERFSSVQGDEFSMFMCAAENSAKVRKLKMSDYNCPSGTKGVENAKIIHAIGKDKFWNNYALKLAYLDWWQWYKEWVLVGGSPSTQKITGGIAIKTQNQLVYAGRVESIWRGIFEDIWNELPKGIVPDTLLHRRFWQIFIQNNPRDLVHFEIEKLDRTFMLSLHVEGDAVNNIEFIKNIEKRFSGIPKILKYEHKYGLGWGSETVRDELPQNILQMAHAIEGLTYKS